MLLLVVRFFRSRKEGGGEHRCRYGGDDHAKAERHEIQIGNIVHRAGDRGACKYGKGDPFMLFHRREKDRDIHTIDGDACRGDHTMREDPTQEVSYEGAELPPEIGERGETEVVGGRESAPFFAREGKDLIRQEETHRKASPARDGDLDLLGE